MLLLKSTTSDDRSIVPPCYVNTDSYYRYSRYPSLSLRAGVFHPNTRIYVRLLGPCFKTGRLRSFCQHPWCRVYRPLIGSHNWLACVFKAYSNQLVTTSNGLDQFLTPRMCYLSPISWLIKWWTVTPRKRTFQAIFPPFFSHISNSCWHGTKRNT